MANALNKIALKGLSDGTDGQIITYDANGNPVAVGPGTDGQVLTSTGAGSPPAFEAIPTPVDATKMPLAGGTFTGDVTFDNQSNAGRDMAWDESADCLKFEDNTKAIFGTGNDTHLYHNGSHTYLSHRGTGSLILEPKEGENGLTLEADGAAKLYYNNVERVATSANGVALAGQIDIADGSGSDGANHIRIGNSFDLRIFHDGTDSYILESGTGHLKIDSSRCIIRNVANNDPMVDCIGGSEVELYHNGTLQCETSANGLAFPSGKGIDFSAHGNAGGMTSELLDDYEEGTFTPSIAAVSAGWNSRTGTYTKVGDLVTVFIHLSTASGGSTNGDQVAITGLPFTSENTNGQAGAVVGYHNGIINDDYNFPFLVTSANTTNINWHKGNGGAFTGNDMNTSHFGLHVSCTYKAA